VEREAVHVAAQFTRQEQRTSIAPPTEPLDAGSALLTHGDPTLHRGRIHRNSLGATTYFDIPPSQVVEIGTQVRL
jgi:hypothetical protein